MNRSIVARLVAVFALAATPVLVGCGGDPDAVAGDDLNATAGVGKFETFKGLDGQHYFHLLAANGEKVLRSEGYASSSGAKKGIESVKTNGVDVAMYDLLEAVNGEFYFNLLAKNGQIIGTSEMYVSESNADRAIDTVREIVAKVNRQEAAQTGGAKFETFRGLDKQYYFHLRAGNGEIVLQSEAYKSKSSATKGVASVRTNGGDADNFEILEAANGQHYLVLKAGNGEIVAHGETYSSLSNAERALESISALIASEKIADPK